MINRPASEYSTYKILFKLEGSGFVTTLYDFEGPFSVWSLTPKGFSVVKNNLPELRDDGFSSDHLNHDRLVQAFQLGEWATHQFPIVEFFTRQERQRKSFSDHPEWVPKSQEHCPDGLTYIKGVRKNYTLAFEVELFPRSSAKYEPVLSYYKHQQSINRVYWLVDSIQTREVILKAKSEIHDESRNYHVYVDLNDFIKNGWDAMIVDEFGKKVHTIRENMQQICGDIYSEVIGKSRGRSEVNVHLNNLKVIGRSKT
jgi:DNA-binding PadR family transcriptional regulator